MTDGRSRISGYRHISGPWGLQVTLTAAASRRAGGKGSLRISDALWLSVDNESLPSEDRDHLSSGLTRVSGLIPLSLGPVTIHVEELSYPLTDYQPEAAAVVAAKWAGEEFGFTPPEVVPVFNRSENRYEFNW